MLNCNSVCPSGNNASEVNQILSQMCIDNGDGLQKIVSFSPYGDSFIKTRVGSILNKYFDTI